MLDQEPGGDIASCTAKVNYKLSFLIGNLHISWGSMPGNSTFLLEISPYWGFFSGTSVGQIPVHMMGQGPHSLKKHIPDSNRVRREILSLEAL